MPPQIFLAKAVGHCRPNLLGRTAPFSDGCGVLATGSSSCINLHQEGDNKSFYDPGSGTGAKYNRWPLVFFWEVAENRLGWVFKPEAREVMSIARRTATILLLESKLSPNW